MSVVKRNIIANLLGGAWITVLTVLMTPMQVNILGIEAYGMVGFISTLQVAFTALDMGLSSTLMRELAADQSHEKRASNELVRTASTIYWISALVIGVALLALAGPIAQRWFKTATLSVSLIEQSLQVIAFYLAMRWPVSLYTGLLTGLQRLDVLNAVKVATASLRLAGGIVVLVHWHSLYAFLLWTALNALVEVLAFAIICHRVHPTMPLWPGIVWPELRRVWRFSVSMNALAILAVLIVQLDRLLISKMLTLEDLGHYNLAYTASSAISFIVGAVSSAVLPSLAAAHGKGSQDELAGRYDRADRMMLCLVGPAAFALMFYGEPILSLWINPQAAHGASPPLAWLAAGFWCSAAIANVYNVAVASGMPGRHLRVNVVSVLPYALALYLLIGSFGIVGAASAWLILNVVYGCLLVAPIHHQLLGVSSRTWVCRILLPFAALGVASFLLPRLAAELFALDHSIRAQAVPLLFSLLFQAAGSLVLLGQRTSDFASFSSLFSTMRSYTRFPK